MQPRQHLMLVFSAADATDDCYLTENVTVQGRIVGLWCSSAIARLIAGTVIHCTCAAILCQLSL